MSIFNDKILKGVAEAAAKIMGEQLKGNQHKIDVAEPKGKITGADFAKLRTMKKEDVEQVKESGEMGAVKDTKGSVLMKHKTSGKEMNVVNSPEVIKQHKDRGYEKVSTMKKEDVEQIDELNKDTLKSYVSKATDSARTMPGYGTNAEKSKKTTRHAGISKATEKLAKGEVYEQVVAEGSKWRSHPDAYDVDDEGNKTPRNPNTPKFGYDPLQRRADTANDAKTPRGKTAALKTSLKMAKGNKGVAAIKEEVELQEMSDMIDALIQEYESKGGVYKHKGTYGTAKGAEYGETDYDKENEMAKKKDKPARKAYGARQNYVRSTRVNESFTELLSKYQEGGVRALNESLYIVEEADNEQFHAEVEENKKKAEGKVKQPEVAKGAVKAVAITKEEVEQVDERQMTEPEMKEREKIVKGMKKGIAGFKQRYGERAKSVMYATATKQAMKD